MAKLTERGLFFDKMECYYTLGARCQSEIVAECRAPKVNGGLCRPSPPTVARSLPAHAAFLDYFRCTEQIMHAFVQVKPP